MLQRRRIQIGEVLRRHADEGDDGAGILGPGVAERQRGSVAHGAVRGPCAAAVQLQVRVVEEPYLLATHGKTYAAYAARVGRFVPGAGRLHTSNPVVR